MKKLFLLLFFFLIFSVETFAATLTVTNCATSEGVYGSLSWALTQASTDDAGIFINFNIPTTDSGYITETGYSFWRINVPQTLRITSNKVFLLGSTQGINQGEKNPFGPEIELRGVGSASLEAVIKVQAVNNGTVEGFAITNSSGYGILLSNCNRTKISKNYVGTSITGEAGEGNSLGGIFVDGGTLNVIGGGTLEGNLVSNNFLHGISFSNATQNIVKNNVVKGNAGYGIYLYGVSERQTIESNVVAENGTGSYPYGIMATGATCKKNYFYKNSMFSNFGDGIKLLNSANDSVAYPQIISSESYEISNRTYVSGTSLPYAKVQIFEVETPEVEGAGEGKTYLFSTEADSSGSWLTYIPVSLSGSKITATQTNTNYSTSQFSINKGPLSMVYERRPDAQIAGDISGSDFVGEDIINLSGDGQKKQKSALAGASLAYYIRATNTGNTNDAFVFFGDPSDSSFEVRYYNSTQEITSFVTAEGWKSPLLASLESVDIAVYASALEQLEMSKNIFITIQSSFDVYKKDVVVATAVATLPPQALSSFTFKVPEKGYVLSPVFITIEARDSLGRITTEVRENTLLSVDYGTVSPESLSPTLFAQKGSWEGEVYFSKEGIRKLTATNGTVSSSVYITTYNASSEYSNESLGVKIIVPKGATTVEATFLIKERSSLPGNPPSGLWQAGKIIEIESNISTFEIPLDITVPLYAGAKTPFVYFWGGSAWSKQGISTYYTDSTKIKFLTSHLTVFVPFSTASQIQYAFGPNPLNPLKESGIFSYWLNEEKETKFFLFDMSGNVVFYRAYPLGTDGGRGGKNEISFDGKDAYGTFLPNGVYFYQISQNGKIVGKGKLIILKR